MWRGVGFAFLSIPAWLVVLQALPDMVRTVCVQGDIVAVLPGPRALPPPASLFSIQFSSTIVRNLGYITLGALALAHARDPLWWRRPTVLGISGAVGPFLPMGRGEGRSLRLGIALFPILAGANLLLAQATGLALIAADRSPFYTNMTAYHAVLLALAAAFGEELVYRGVLQQGTLSLLRDRIRPFWLAVAVAVTVQAIPFAYLHAGYGNPQLLLFAFLFAVVAGIVAQWLGLWCAIALHALIDFYVFFLGVPEPGVVFQAVVVIVSLGVLSVAAIEGWRGVQHFAGRKRRA